MGTTNILSIQTLEQNQNNKYLTLNFSTNVLEALTVGVFTNFITNTAQATQPGQLFIVSPTAGGNFTLQRNNLAYYDGTSLTFFVPAVGMELTRAITDVKYRFSGTVWDDLPLIKTLTVTGTNIPANGGSFDISIPRRSLVVQAFQSTQVLQRLRIYTSATIRTNDTVAGNIQTDDPNIFDIELPTTGLLNFLQATHLLSASAIVGRIYNNRTVQVNTTIAIRYVEGA